MTKVQSPLQNQYTPQIDQITRFDQVQIESAKSRRQSVVQEKNEYNGMANMLNALENVAGKMRTSADFTNLRVDSSHPDIVDGEVIGHALPGNYELEIRGLAQTDKYLDIGFSDKNSSPVGFGYMAIERDDGELEEIVVEPGSTLEDVTNTINASSDGVKAMVVDTGIGKDPYRLMVTSTKTGAAAKVHIDEDTTYLDMKHLKDGRNLDMVFEDVPISRPENSIKDLLDGIKFNAKRSEPGTRVQVNVVHDLETTVESIKNFTSKYNEIANFTHNQFSLNPETKRLGNIADSTTRSVMRNLQSSVSNTRIEGQKFGTLAEIGITTNAKTGELQVDDKKLKQALAEDYDGVAKLFTYSESGEGLANTMTKALQLFRDPAHGVLKTRINSLDKIIKEQDQNIEKQSERLESKRQMLEQQFIKLNSRVDAMNSQEMYFNGLSAQHNTNIEASTNKQLTEP